VGGGPTLETGWLPDTPIGDTVLRRFLHNQADVLADFARTPDGRTARVPGAALIDAGGPVPYFNQALLLRPLHGADDPVLTAVEEFFGPAGGRPFTSLSAWPTPDLAGRGWTLVGHPAFMVRSPGPHERRPPPETTTADVPATGVAVAPVTRPADLLVAEQIAVDGYPIDEARDRPPGTVLPPGLLGGGTRVRLGFLDGAPVAAAAVAIGHGVVNLCFAATLPAARRRGVWEALVWTRVDDAPDLPAVSYTSDFSRPGFERMGFLPVLRFTLWMRTGAT
jgi:hypothetical protein